MYSVASGRMVECSLPRNIALRFPPQDVAWALVLRLWGILLLIFWKRRCSELVERWSLGGLANVETMRKDYLARKTEKKHAQKQASDDSSDQQSRRLKHARLGRSVSHVL